jgi:DNA-binding transcriptional LysR family regulator
LASFPASVVRANGERYGLKVLPVRLEAQPWPIALVTLKGRALNPVAQRFIEHVQAFLSPLQQRDRQANTALRT